MYITKNLRIIKGSFILFFIGFSFVLAHAQNPDSLVWPGDINNNGLVNHIDALFLGAAYGTQGESRNSQTIQWNGVDAPQWQNEFPEGLSMSFADCNGDGVVLDNDLQAIQVNYGLTHDMVFEDSFLLDPNALNTQIVFDTLGTQIIANPGAAYTIPVNLGENNELINNFYGVAFTLQVNTDYIDLSTLDFVDYEGEWTNPNNEGVIKIQERDFSENTFEVALSRTSMTTIDGFGSIGKLSFIIEGDVPDFAPDTELILIKDVHLVDENLTKHYLVDGGNLILNMTNAVSNLPKNTFSIYPNPISNGYCIISGLEQYPEARITLFDVVGREIPIEMNGNRINTGELPVGMYFINIQTSKGQWTERVFIKNEF